MRISAATRNTGVHESNSSMHLIEAIYIGLYSKPGSVYNCLLHRNQRPACAMPKIPERSWLVVLLFIHCNADRCAVRALCRATNALGESARKDVQNRCTLIGWKLIPDAIAMISFWAPKCGQCKVYYKGAINQVAKDWFKRNLWVYKIGRDKDRFEEPYVAFRCLVSQLPLVNLHCTYVNGEWVPNHKLCRAVSA